MTSGNDRALRSKMSGLAADTWEGLICKALSQSSWGEVLFRGEKNVTSDISRCMFKARPDPAALGLSGGTGAKVWDIHSTRTLGHPWCPHSLQPVAQRAPSVHLPGLKNILLLPGGFPTGLVAFVNLQCFPEVLRWLDHQSIFYLRRN